MHHLLLQAHLPCFNGTKGEDLGTAPELSNPKYERSDVWFDRSGQPCIKLRKQSRCAGQVSKTRWGAEGHQRQGLQIRVTEAMQLAVAYDEVYVLLCRSLNAANQD